MVIADTNIRLDELVTRMLSAQVETTVRRDVTERVIDEPELSATASLFTSESMSILGEGVAKLCPVVSDGRDLIWDAMCTFADRANTSGRAGDYECRPFGLGGGARFERSKAFGSGTRGRTCSSPSGRARSSEGVGASFSPSTKRHRTSANSFGDDPICRIHVVAESADDSRRAALVELLQSDHAKQRELVADHLGDLLDGSSLAAVDHNEIAVALVRAALAERTSATLS